MPNNRMKQLPKPKQNKTDKLARLIDYLEQFGNSDFNGYIRINFSQGNVGRIEKLEKIFNRNEE